MRAPPWDHPWEDLAAMPGCDASTQQLIEYYWTAARAGLQALRELEGIMAKPTMPKLRVGPNRLTAKPLSPAPRGMLAPKPPGQSNNPGAVKRAARGGKK